MLKSFLKVIFAVALIIVSATLIIQMKYDISLNEYLAYSQPLTREETQFLKEEESLTCGVIKEDAPFSMTDEERSEPSGLTIDYIDILSKELNIPIYIQNIKAGEETKELRSGSIDIANLATAAKGSNQYVSSQQLYELDNIIVSMYESDITYLNDLPGKKIAILKNDTLEQAIQGVMPKGGKCEYVYVESLQDAFQMLEEGKVSALAGNEITINYYAEKLDLENSIKEIGDIILTTEISFAVDVYNTKLYNILNKAILSLKKDGAFDGTQKAWLGNSAAIVTNSTSVKWAEAIIIFSVIIVEFLMFWESILNRKIDKKTMELRIEKKNLQTIIDNIDALIAVINGEDIVIQCNAFARKLLEDERASFLGCGISTIDILSDLYKLYCDSPNERYYAYKQHEYDISIRTLNKAKGTRLLLIYDVTESNIVERRFMQENKMAAVGQLSAGLAHEIRNPLGLIKNYSYILQDYATDDMAEHSLEVIDSSVGRIDSLIENLLRFSRLGNENIASFDLEKMLLNILGLERKKLEAEGIEISFSCEEDLMIKSAEETIKIVAFNLINNAADALSKSDKPTKRLEIDVTSDDENGFVEMTFADNGTGIEEDKIGKIFDPFFTTKSVGTGLGLYIVSSELEKIGGEISVESKLTEGTIFTVKVPMGNDERKETI